MYDTSITFTVMFITIFNLINGTNINFDTNCLNVATKYLAKKYKTSHLSNLLRQESLRKFFF